MEPGWQRNVVVGVILALWVVGFGLTAGDDGKTFGEGVAEALRIAGLVLAIFITERLIPVPAVRFLSLALSLVAISAVYQLTIDGRATWTAAAWAVAVAALVTVVQLIVAAVSRRPTAT